MTSTDIPLIGFDRFIARDWLDLALTQALVDGTVADLRTQLKPFLRGEAALKKTTSVLAGIWLRYYPKSNSLRKEALQLAPVCTPAERLVLHWGMILVHYPFFRSTVGIMGRLLRLQGDFRSQEVRQRVLEIIGNVGTAPRAVSRIIQSVKEWGVIIDDGGRYRANDTITIEKTELAGWLIKAYMISDNHDSWHVPDLLRASELFPFDLENYGLIALHHLPHFVFRYEGLDKEIAILKTEDTMSSVFPNQ